MEPLSTKVDKNMKMRSELVLEECGLLKSSSLAVLPLMGFLRVVTWGHNDFM